MTSLKAHFSRSLGAAPGRIHLAAHSHHLWPDVSWEAHRQAWLDAAALADRKWDKVFGEILPAAQAQVARVLDLGDPGTVVFAPNTHDFVVRLLSCLPAGRPPRILTTDAEFHSFARQVRRLEEEGLAEVTRVPAQPFAGFADRFAAAAAAGGHDLVFFSQVFFNSGYVVADLAGVVGAVPDDGTLIAIDGYHGFLAVPTSLRAIERRAFYIAGGYKYAMAGEGACFMHCPPGYGARPRNTGWYAAFGALHGPQDGRVPYAEDASRFRSSTFDPTALYRFAAVLGWLERIGLDTPEILARSHALQDRFVAGLAALGLPDLDPGRLLVPLDEPRRGRFLTYETARAGAIHERLMAADIVTDYRADRLRFGFGLYHDPDDVPAMVDRIAAALAG